MREPMLPPKNVRGMHVTHSAHPVANQVGGTYDMLRAHRIGSVARDTFSQTSPLQLAARPLRPRSLVKRVIQGFLSL